MSEYIFTKDFFSKNISNWEKILNYLNRTFGNNLNCLEVGSYEGRATIYMLDNFVGQGNLTNIDIFLKDEVKEIFFNNTSKHPKHKQLKTIIGSSVIEMSKLYEQNLEFDFIYIDAGKTASDNCANLIFAERICKLDGIILVDDYDWVGSVNPKVCPKLGIESFIDMTLLTQIFFKNYQVAFKKIKNNSDLAKHNI